MKKCLYCNVEFTPKNPKGKFCSDNHRVYWNRQNKPASPGPIEIQPKGQQKVIPTVGKISLEEIKSRCPAELTGLDRSAWISQKRQELGI